MQGIKVQLNQDSVKRVKEQFSKLLEDLQKSADKNQILVSVSEINKALNNMATQVKNVQSALSSVKSKLKVFDVDEIKKESTEVFKTIDDVKRKYANLGDAVSFSISKDDDGKEIGIIAQIKRNDGVVEKFNHSLINLAKNGQIVEQAFKLDNSVEYEKIEASMNVLSKYESQLNKIKNSYSKADLQDNTHVEQLNKEYSSMLNKIQQLVKSQDVLSNRSNASDGL
jgi:hypothetical protein